VKVSSYPLGTTFGGVSVSVTQGATTVAALPVYVSAGQINAVMPSNAPLGIAAVKVTFNGQASGVAPVRIVASSPGIFTIAPVVSANDLFHFQFIKTTGGAFSFSPMFGQPPEGSCTVYLSPGDALGHDGIPAAPSIASRLSAGASFTLTGPGGVQNLTPLAGAPGVSLGSYAPFAPGLPNQLTLSPGSYTIAAPGGAEVGPFSAGVTLPQPFTWTNQNTLSTVDRTQNLVLSWSGAPSGQVVTILGFSMDRPSNSSGVFYCTAPKNATSFTVPSEVLSALPATQSNILRSKGVIYVMTMTEANGTAFKAPGLDAAIAIAGYMFGTTVIFQ